MSNQGVGNLGFGGSTGGGGGGGGTVIITQATQTPATQDISGLAGNTLATWFSFTFVVGQGSCLIGGVAFGVGTYTFDNGAGNLNTISYDASGSNNTNLLIQQ
jgi:hypothetical protein